MSRTQLASALAVLVLISVSFIIYWEGIRPRYLPDSNELLAVQGAKAYSKLPMDRLTSPETIRESLAHTQIVLNGLATKRQAQAVLDQTADFLWYRFGQPPITEYEQWRRDSGYRMRPLSEIESAAFEYKNLLGKPIPDNQSAQKTFEEVVNISDQYEGGANHASGLAANENGIRLIRRGKLLQLPFECLRLATPLYHLNNLGNGNRILLAWQRSDERFRCAH